MEIGTGIALASAVLGIVAVIFKIFGRDKTVTIHCEDHSGICSNIQTLTDWLNKIEAKLDRVIERRV